MMNLKDKMEQIYRNEPPVTSLDEIQLNKDKVVVLDSGYNSYVYEERLFRDAGYQFEIFHGERHDRAGKKEFARDAVGILVRWTEINDDFFQSTKNVKAVVRYGVGYDNVDVDSATQHNVRVANVQGYANHAVSDHAIALMYACARALPQGKKSLKQNFTKPPIMDIPEIHTLILGIIGLGSAITWFAALMYSIAYDREWDY